MTLALATPVDFLRALRDDMTPLVDGVTILRGDENAPAEIFLHEKDDRRRVLDIELRRRLDAWPSRIFGAFLLPMDDFHVSLKRDWQTAKRRGPELDVAAEIRTFESAFLAVLAAAPETTAFRGSYVVSLSVVPGNPASAFFGLEREERGPDGRTAAHFGEGEPPAAAFASKINSWVRGLHLLQISGRIDLGSAHQLAAFRRALTESPARTGTAG